MKEVERYVDSMSARLVDSVGLGGAFVAEQCRMLDVIEAADRCRDALRAYLRSEGSLDDLVKCGSRLETTLNALTTEAPHD